MSVLQGHLADGREIFYFDEHSRQTLTPDERDLPAIEIQSALRFDALLGEWVTLAGHRQDRTHLPPDGQCPLCPSHAGRRTEIPAERYDVVVFENRFPAFVEALAEEVSGPVGFFRQRPA